MSSCYYNINIMRCTLRIPCATWDKSLWSQGARVCKCHPRLPYLHIFWRKRQSWSIFLSVLINIAVIVHPMWLNWHQFILRDDIFADGLTDSNSMIIWLHTWKRCNCSIYFTVYIIIKKTNKVKHKYIQACNQNSAARGAMIFLRGAITYNKFSYGQLKYKL